MTTTDSSTEHRHRNPLMLVLLTVLVIAIVSLGLAALLQARDKVPNASSQQSMSDGSDKANGQSSGPTAKSTTGNPVGASNAAGNTGQSGQNSTGAAGSPVANSQASTITISSTGFSPATITAKKGQPVTWLNQDSARHAIDKAAGSDTGPHSPQLATGQSYTYVYNKLGSFKYICVLHPDQGGTVTVID